MAPQPGPSPRRRASRRIAAAGAAFTLLVARVAWRTPRTLENLEGRVYDLFLRSVAHRPASAVPVIVDIDEESLSRYGQWPWPRYRIALLLDRARELGAAAVAPAPAVLAAHRLARGILLDTLDPAQAGGTGRCFDWSLLPARHPPLVLAGGLDAANVGEAIRVVRPYAVDVSSGVESAPGIKDPGRIGEFMRAVRRANEALPAPAGEQHDELA